MPPLKRLLHAPSQLRTRGVRPASAARGLVRATTGCMNGAATQLGAHRHQAERAARVTGRLWLGLVLWGVVFSVASALYPWEIVDRRLFESIMSVVLAWVTTCVATAYLRGLEGRILARAIVAALSWPLTCVALDLVVSMLAPPRFSMREYAEAIGVNYLMIPAIVLGLTYQRLRVEAASQRRPP